MYNRGTAFTLAERDALGIAGLFPEAVDTLDIQVARAQTQLAALSEDLQKYLFLSDLQNRNLTLFYALLMSDPATFMPLVYTPTVGRSLPKVRSHLSRTQGSLSAHHGQRTAQGPSTPLAGKGRPIHCGDGW